MQYREVEGIDENGNKTTFKIEIPNVKTQKKKVVKKEQLKYGIFTKQGYHPLYLFTTREEAETRLQEMKMPHRYEVREIIAW